MSLSSVMVPSVSDSKSKKAHWASASIGAMMYGMPNSCSSSCASVYIWSVMLAASLSCLPLSAIRSLCFSSRQICNFWSSSEDSVVLVTCFLLSSSGSTEDNAVLATCCLLSSSGSTEDNAVLFTWCLLLSSGFAEEGNALLANCCLLPSSSSTPRLVPTSLSALTSFCTQFSWVLVFSSCSLPSSNSMDLLSSLPPLISSLMFSLSNLPFFVPPKPAFSLPSLADGLIIVSSGKLLFIVNVPSDVCAQKISEKMSSSMSHTLSCCIVSSKAFFSEVK